jgi:hypothetical protein
MKEKIRLTVRCRHISFLMIKHKTMYRYMPIFNKKKGTNQVYCSQKNCKRRCQKKRIVKEKEMEEMIVK